MDLFRHYILTIIIFLPAAGAGAVMLLRNGNAIRWTALGVAIATFIATLLLPLAFDWHAAQSYSYAENGGVVQLALRVPWIKSLGIEYLVGIDGLSLPLVMVTAFVCLLAIAAAWKTEKSVAGCLALLLLLESTALGAFLSLDFFLFYIFFNLSLVPVYFLISAWGGPRKRNAAIKFFIYSAIASIAVLIAMIGIYLDSRLANPGSPFDLVRLAGRNVGGGASRVFFVLLLAGFLVRLAAFPVHTWLADTHGQAPMALSMILPAVVLNVGGYGILRIAYPLFPQAAQSMWIVLAVLGVLTILYGGLCAMAQTDVRRLASFCTISTMGLIVLGASMMTSTALSGALFTMVSAALSGAALFFGAGIISNRAGHSEISRLGGLFDKMPVFSRLAIAAFLAAMGVPGFCFFIGEILVFLGAFECACPGGILYDAAAHGNLPWFLPAVWTLASLACIATVLTAACILRTIQRVFLGIAQSEYKNARDLTPRETTILTALNVMMILLGIFPTPLFFSFTSQTVSAIFTLLQTGVSGLSNAV